MKLFHKANPVGEWISVDEKMPKEDAMFMVKNSYMKTTAFFCLDRCYPLLKFYNNIDPYMHPSYWWQTETGESIRDVTHWKENAMD
jgi:hypothetical protein